MPIYAYRCERCGHAKDVIQKFSDAPLALCPSCGADAFRKQLTAPAFQLKGSGWYVTDFRDNGKKAAAADKAPATETGEAPPSPPSTDAAAAPAGEAAKPAETAVKAQPAVAPPAPGRTQSGAGN
jgi:putative FmdB family regulatory protein